MSAAIIFETDGEVVALHPDEIADEDIISQAINCKTALTLRIYPQFEAWRFCRQTLTYVTMLDLGKPSDRIAFIGRVSAVTDSMDSSGRLMQEITCVSAADYLEDTAFVGSITLTPIATWLTGFISVHNGQVDAPRQLSFSVDLDGDVRVRSDSELVKTRYQTLAEVLTGGNDLYLQVQHEGYSTIGLLGYTPEFRERYQNGSAYIDIARRFGSAKDTAIRTGENLRAIKVEQSVDGGIYTAVRAVSGVNSDGKRWYTDVENAAMAQRYGTGRVKLITNDDIKCTKPISGDTPTGYSEAWIAMVNALHAFAEREAAKLSEPYTRIVLEATDPPREDGGYEVGSSYPVIAPELGIRGEPMRVTALTRYLNGRTKSITIERGQKPGVYVSKGPGLSNLLGVLDYYNSKQDEQAAAQTEIAATKAEEQTDGYVFGDKTQQEYDELPATSKLKTRGFCVIRDSQTGDVTGLKVNGADISSGGGGGGGTIEYAAILSEEQMSEWAPDHELTPLWFRGTATVYYGQAPARFVVQGNRVIWGNTAVIENDLSSEVTFEDFDGTIKTWKVYIYSLSAVADYMRVLLGCAVYDEYGNLLESSHSATYSRVPYTAQRIKIGLVPTVSDWTLRNNKLYPTVEIKQEMFIDGARELYGTKTVGSISTPGLVPCTDAERDFGLALTTTTEPIAPT